MYKCLIIISGERAKGEIDISTDRIYLYKRSFFGGTKTLMTITVPEIKNVTYENGDISIILNDGTEILLSNCTNANSLYKVIKTKHQRYLEEIEFKKKVEQLKSIINEIDPKFKYILNNVPCIIMALHAISKLRDYEQAREKLDLCPDTKELITELSKTEPANATEKLLSIIETNYNELVNTINSTKNVDKKFYAHVSDLLKFEILTNKAMIYVLNNKEVPQQIVDEINALLLRFDNYIREKEEKTPIKKVEIKNLKDVFRIRSLIFNYAVYYVNNTRINIISK